MDLWSLPGGLAILTTAITHRLEHGFPPTFAQNTLNSSPIFLIQRPPKACRIVRCVLADAHARANNDSANVREVQHPSRGNIRDAHLHGVAAVFVRDLVESFEELLEESPVAPGLDHAVVLEFVLR